MKKFCKSIITTTLLLLALLFISCANELEEEFRIEVDPNSYEEFIPEDPYAEIDYFILYLEKVEEIRDESQGDVPRILDGERLNKGDVLRLDYLKPGFYNLFGSAWKSADEENPEDELLVNISVHGVSNNMVNVNDTECFVVEPGHPTVVKLSLFFHPN